MRNDSCEALYEIVKLVEESEGKPDLEAVKSRLTDQMKLRIIPAGESIFHIEDQRERVYFVICGSFINYRISVNGKINVVSREKAPRWNGVDRALKLGRINFTENRTLEETAVLEIKTGCFLKALEENGRFGLYMLRHILNKMTGISEKSDHLLFDDTRGRLVSTILKYWKENRSEDGSFRIETTNVSLADEAGISIRSLYRGISSLKKEGRISVRKGRIVVSQQQVEALEKAFKR